MGAADVVHVVALLDGAGARFWVDGGWGVDALLGTVSRAHSDLDLVIPADDLELVCSVLDGAGFSRVLRDWRPTALAVADSSGREVDLHPITPTPDGGGDQRLPEGQTFHYPPPVAGVIEGHQVRCVDARTQVLCHLGYVPTDKDRGDMRRLRARCGVSLPAPYCPMLTYMSIPLTWLGHWIAVAHSESDVDSIRRMAGLATPMALRVAVTLGLPDRLLGDGVAVDGLAAELDVDPVALDLLLDHLATVGIVERVSTGFRTTDLGANLCVGAGNDLIRVLLDLDSAGGRAELAFVELADSIRTGQAAYPRRYGQDFWADLAAQPRLRESFDRQMTYRFRAQIPGIVAGVDWARFATIVDVGGGGGGLLAAILAAHPRARGHLVDLEPTAAEALHTFSAQGLAARTQVTAGSFFDPLPAGADAYVLSDILHDWDDEHAHLILAGCVEAAPPAGRVLVIEPVGGRRAASEFNLAMLVQFGGRERRIDEFRSLAEPHGLVLATVADLTDQRCLLEFRLT